MPADAKICAVVLSLHSDLRARDAALSLLGQDVPAEIVVVNTGEGSLREHLSHELDRVVLVECGERQLPGSARNLGIRHSAAPVIAFLACDCVAPPGWLRTRLNGHQAGERVVSSALLPAPDDAGVIGRNAWAAYAMTHIGRTPQTGADLASRYGLSYERSLFIRHGFFDEKLEVGEDTEFNARVAAEEAIGWHPAVVTLHRYPHTMRGAMADQVLRGRRAAAYHRARSGRSPLRHLSHVFLHGLLVQRRIGDGLSPPETRKLPVRLLAVLLVIANMVGALSLYVRGGSPVPRGAADRA